MTNRRVRTVLPAVVVGLTLFAARVHGQAVPWEVFIDTESASVCGVVNAATAELVVLRCTGELVIVSGVDFVIPDIFVDSEGFVFFGLGTAGFIDFADDGDGFRTLWWISETGHVFDVDPFTLHPIETALFPGDISNIACNACEFWDDPTACILVIFDEDGDCIEDADDVCPHTPIGELTDAAGCSCSQLDLDADGIDNCDDLCPATPSLEFVDLDGCSCSQLDSDLDGVDDCDDLCLDTPFGEEVDFDGCRVVFVSPPAITVNFCGSFGAAALAMTFCGLIGLRRF
jgi:hypothetical protein